MAIKNIMVVDDSATDRFVLVEMLQNQGFNCTQAVDAEDCLARIEAEQPDLVMMDILMPGQNGFQATRAISKNIAISHIPVVLYSGKSQATDKAWGLKMGAVDCLAKPVIEAELMALIQQLGG
jgi:twitching motility two-component system response regulator PilH